MDLDRGLLLLEDSKTGEREVLLNAAAMQVLAGLPRSDDNPYVIQGRRSGEHLVNLQLPWRRIRQRADLEDVRIHDLRHSFASIGAGLGLGLPMIGALLGHTQPATTQRYAHVDASPQREAAEAIGSALRAVMDGGGGEVVPFKKRQPR